MTTRTYVMRAYLFCHLCDRRMWGGVKVAGGSAKKASESARRYVYYQCKTNPKHHGHLPWYPQHPRHIGLREDQIVEPVARFFQQRVFGANRKIYWLTPCPPPAREIRNSTRAAPPCMPSSPSCNAARAT